MDLGLAGRTFAITGGTRGLGFAVAEALVGEGANVLVSSRDETKVEDALERLGPTARGLVADVLDPSTPGALVRAARDEFGGLDGGFVSHGGPESGNASDLDDDLLDTAFALAILGPIRVVRRLARELEAGGSIVVLTSSSSVQPIPGLASSNVARPAVWGYVKTLADEVAPRGIRVNALLPGRFATDRVAELEAARADLDGTSLEEVRRATEQAIPLRRLGDPAELGRVAAFLLSPAASYVTGCAWAVDGGAIRGL